MSVLHFHSIDLDVLQNSRIGCRSAVIEIDSRLDIDERHCVSDHQRRSPTMSIETATAE